jgi:tetratricopeptide (TPR) repeat protein
MPTYQELRQRHVQDAMARVGELIGRIDWSADRLAAHRRAELRRLVATAQAVLAARIDRLPPEEKRLLQTAAVIGHEVPWPLLQMVADLPEDTLHRGMAHLQAAEFLYETRLFPDQEYTFKHALTHEVAYASLLQERRRGLHARIVTAIEALYADRLAEQVDRLAHHTLRGEVWEKALTYCRQAGTKAVAHSVNRVAVACFEQVLVALQHLPARQELIEQAIDTRLDLRDALFPLDEYSRLIGYLREAELLAKTSGDQRRLGWVSAHMAHYFCLTGDQPQAIDAGQRALSIAASLREVTLQARAHHTLGMIYHALGDYRRAINGFREAIASLDGGLLQDRVGMSAHTTVYSRAWLVQCLGEQGAFTEGIAIGEEAIQQAEAVKYPFTRINAYFGVGRMYLRKGDLQHAIPLLEQGLELCTLWNIPVPLPIVTSQLGYAYALSGRLAEALPLLQQAVERKAAVRVAWDQSVRMAWLSEAFLLAGRIDEAIELAVQAFDFSCEHEERGHEAWALRLLGEIHSHRAPPAVEQAEGSYQDALTLADELGMRPLQAHCHHGLGTLYAKIGRTEQAQVELSTAIDLYRAMDMTFWLSQAEAALAQVEG